jgi:DNA (cytosine-5)-methyltransferase 1
VDLFAGGGGWSVGVEMALHRPVDLAVNHDEDALQMHELNHPTTKHKKADVFEVCPHLACEGHPVEYLHGSPDCTDHSKAKGGKPIRARKRRALAWVLVRWAGQVRPPVITMENVEEIRGWGPLRARRDKATGRVVRLDGTVAAPGEVVPLKEQWLERDPTRAGRTFRAFVRALEGLGYRVEFQERRACNAGAPTIRKRLYMIARCDGLPIVWPEPTHGDPKSEAVRSGRLLPWRTAAECIDWRHPMLSIFATKEEAKAWGKAHGQAPPVRPLADATMRRTARGVRRYVLPPAKPFVVTLNHGGGREHAPRGLDEPLRTVAAARDAHGLVAPLIAGVGGRAGQLPERPGDVPFGTVTGKADVALVAPLLTEHANASAQRTFAIDEPLRTQVADVKGGHFSLVAPVLVDAAHGEVSPDGRVKRWGSGARSSEEPAPTILGTGNPALVVASMLPNPPLFRYLGHGERFRTPRDRRDRGVTIGVPRTGRRRRPRHVMCAPVVVPNNTNNAAHAVDEPVPTVTGGGRNILAAAILVPRYGERDGQEPRVRSLEEPTPVVVPTDNGGSLAAVHLASYHAERAEGDRGHRGGDAGEPADTIDTANRHAVVAAFLAQHNDGFYQGDGRSLENPAGTVCASGSPQGLVVAHVSHFRTGATGQEADTPLCTVTANSFEKRPGGAAPIGIVAASLTKLRGTSTDADPAEPLDTVSAGGTHHALAAVHLSHDHGHDPAGGEGSPEQPARAVPTHPHARLVAAFLQKYYGAVAGQDSGCDEPVDTISTRDRMGLVTVVIEGVLMVIADIAMRMLQPRELYNAQGFPRSYMIDRGADGGRFTKTAQVRMCGNSVPPPEAMAITAANLPHLRAQARAA